MCFIIAPKIITTIKAKSNKWYDFSHFGNEGGSFCCFHLTFLFIIFNFFYILYAKTYSNRISQVIIN
ncbi:hypothetical protein ACM44_11750 [Chryseobacterium koreense CCUG 49689]|uniref:Uncharacterized protein n=1 Tax=Chryseobacterium koreense CCUG 49689 TaxID=1304281 RepID=A0A0J7LNE4_9FLAO|nr:hypothetical protein ACM44_11750 [Chryseobacterium koreense CCUG 49689]